MNLSGRWVWVRAHAVLLVVWPFMSAISIDAVGEDKHLTPAWVTCHPFPFLSCPEGDVAVDDYRGREEKKLHAKYDEGSQRGKHLTKEMPQALSAGIPEQIDDCQLVANRTKLLGSLWGIASGRLRKCEHEGSWELRDPSDCTVVMARA